MHSSNLLFKYQSLGGPCDYVIFPLFLKSKKRRSIKHKNKISGFTLCFSKLNIFQHWSEGRVTWGDCAAVWGARDRSAQLCICLLTLPSLLDMLLQKQNSDLQSRWSPGLRKNCSSNLGVQLIGKKQREMSSIGTLCLQLQETSENRRKPFILGTWCWRQPQVHLLPVT